MSFILGALSCVLEILLVILFDRFSWFLWPFGPCCHLGGFLHVQGCQESNRGEEGVCYARLEIALWLHCALVEWNWSSMSFHWAWQIPCDLAATVLESSSLPLTVLFRVSWAKRQKVALMVFLKTNSFIYIFLKAEWQREIPPSIGLLHHMAAAAKSGMIQAERSQEQYPCVSPGLQGSRCVSQLLWTVFPGTLAWKQSSVYMGWWHCKWWLN